MRINNTHPEKIGDYWFEIAEFDTCSGYEMNVEYYCYPRKDRDCTAKPRFTCAEAVLEDDVAVGAAKREIKLWARELATEARDAGCTGDDCMYCSHYKDIDRSLVLRVRYNRFDEYGNKLPHGTAVEASIDADAINIGVGSTDGVGGVDGVGATDAEALRLIAKAKRLAKAFDGTRQPQRWSI